MRYLNQLFNVIGSSKKLEKRCNVASENNKAEKQVQQVAATMAVEEMYLSDELKEKLLKVAEGKMSSEDIRKDVLDKYAQ